MNHNHLKKTSTSRIKSIKEDSLTASDNFSISQAPSAQKDNREKPATSYTAKTARQGIFYILGAIFLFSVANTIIKECAGRYPINEITFYRFLFSLLPAAYFVVREAGWQGFKTTHVRLQIIRGIQGTIGLGLIFYSFGAEHFVDAVAINFSFVFFTAILGIVILKERIHWSSWLAIIGGFCGVALIAKPTGDIIRFAALTMLIGSAMDALTMVLGRFLTRKIPCSTCAFYFNVVAVIISGLSLFFWSRGPTLPDLFLLFLAGLLGGLAQYWITRGFHLTPAFMAGLMSYSAIIWSSLFGFLFWHEVPTLATVLGVAVIIASGVYIIYQTPNYKA